MDREQLLLNWEDKVDTGSTGWATHTIFVDGIERTISGRHLATVVSKPGPNGSVFYNSIYRMRNGQFIGRRDYVMRDEEGYRGQWRCLCVDELEVVKFFGVGPLSIQLFERVGLDHEAVILKAQPVFSSALDLLGQKVGIR